MGDRVLRPEDMASTSTAVSTTISPPVEETQEQVAVITLRQTKTETRKKVLWTEDTIDNEHMNKKKSKCCCIYEKPHKFGESDSEDSEDECEHCFGHVERRKKHTHGGATVAAGGTGTVAADVLDSAAPEPTATLTLQPPEDQKPTEPSAPTS